jgi:hypothetical protein
MGHNAKLRAQRREISDAVAADNALPTDFPPTVENPWGCNYSLIRVWDIKEVTKSDWMMCRVVVNPTLGELMRYLETVNNDNIALYDTALLRRVAEVHGLSEDDGVWLRELPPTYAMSAASYAFALSAKGPWYHMREQLNN